MQTYARIAGDVIAELIEIPEDGPPLEERYHPDLVAQLLPLPEGSEAAEGWRYDAQAEAFTPPAPPAPAVPASISRRQLLLALAGAGLITPEEALAAATTGAVPAAIDAVFAGLPEAEALGARITWATMSVAERDHPLIGALIAADLATPEQVDALFLAGAAL